MPDLKDVTNPDPNPQGAAAATEPVKEPAALSPEDKDAAEVGRILLGSGYAKEQINQLLDAPRALDALRYAVKNDPEEFIRSLERTDPGAGENFLDKLSKLYVERYDKSGAPAASGDGKQKDAPSAELFDKVRELEGEVGRFKSQAAAQAQAASDAQMSARYKARVEDLFSQLPKDKFPLADHERALVTDALSARLAADPSAVQRVRNGNFVDVPTVFKSIMDSVANGRKAAADAEKSARDKASRTMFPSFEGGPLELPKEFMAVPESNSADDIWDVNPLVKALEASGR